ncbi:MAG: thiamine pyrophosphate-binding protein, partial [Gammaproteobacteria bacterium]|nr:thiamine pyrophosphate-binding protein [Gammaproteobacteria bacterium]
MADAVARLSGEVAVALLTAGPGHANAVSALYTARCSESPVLMLSGHAPTGGIGRGAFQEMPQVEMASTVTKEAWMPTEAHNLGHELARAFRVPLQGRPGPVHLSLPFDLLNARIDGIADRIPDADAFKPADPTLDTAHLDQVLDLLGGARRPLVLVGPSMVNSDDGEACTQLAERLGVPVVAMQSPRGLKDPVLGAFHERLPETDLVLLLGKPLDFTVRFGESPPFAGDCRIAHVDAERACLERTRGNLAAGDRLAALFEADPKAMLRGLLQANTSFDSDRGWYRAVSESVTFRPPEWRQPIGTPAGQVGIHPVDALRALDAVLDESSDPIFVCDGGEIGQWAQAVVGCRRRVINGPSGSIGGSLSFALGLKAARPQATVVALMGDGTFGFHMSELDTGVRNGLAITCMIGNDACWNAEHQIQLRDYGADRTHSCELLPSRYDQVCVALGGHGEQVERAEDVAPALRRALASQRTAVLNVLTARVAAPDINSTSS